MISTVHTFTVTPRLPARLQALDDISKNMWWCWTSDAIHLFNRLDLDVWNEVYHNPRALLGKVSQERLNAVLDDEGFLALVDRVKENLDAYMAEKGWYGQHAEAHPETRIAYFSAEFGIHESVPVYSGGLGCLAGDHLKSASDLGLPLVGVGLAYREGYFRQYLNHDGWQQESYPENDFHNMPFGLQTDEQGQPLVIDIHLGGHLVYAQIWKVQVGRIPLYLLDTNIGRNSPEDRAITGQLYGGDREMRIKQEILLGIGGVRALDAVRQRPSICHINEGHAAFAALERLRLLMRERGVTYAQAFELVYHTNVFTTHTPVPAGHDVFEVPLVDKYLSYYARELGMGLDEFHRLGNDDPTVAPKAFSMTALAINMSAHRNGVSRLHGEVAREMASKMWPGLPGEETPIDHVTNGVHLNSWLSMEMQSLYERYLGPRFRTEAWNKAVWDRVDRIPDAELWRTHERRRERLVAFARSRLQKQLMRRGVPFTELQGATEVLDPEALTIGFARRFATYKRATLLLKDMDRLRRILSCKERPVQLIFAGKAHPQDAGGKALIKEIVALAKDPEFRKRIVFVEDYDINVGRYLVQGVDVWLNTPRRPMEASGTSGMKAAAQGGLNCSILDGWWDEGFEPGNGFAIGAGETYDDIEAEDFIESLALYEILEKEVVPTFYKRGDDGVPHEWVARMKRSIRTCAPVFNTDRMVQDYTRKFYTPGTRSFFDLSADGMKRASDLADYRAKLRRSFGGVRVERVVADTSEDRPVGEKIPVAADIVLGDMRPEEVRVDIYYGPLDNDGRLRRGATVAMKVDAENYSSTQSYRFVGELPCVQTGLNGFAVRILPNHPDLVSPIISTMIKWA